MEKEPCHGEKLKDKFKNTLIKILMKKVGSSWHIQSRLQEKINKETLRKDTFWLRSVTQVWQSAFKAAKREQDYHSKHKKVWWEFSSSNSQE